MRKGSRRMSDNIARTIRDFNGLGVGRFPLSGELSERGVYALYCTADKGIYGRYGQGVNNCRYQVPIYVGCTSKSSKRQADAFATQSLYEQFDFWQSAIRRSVDLDLHDFGFRWHEFANPADDLEIARALRKLYRPVWNEILDDALCLSDFSARWAECHDLRFHSRNQSVEARNVRISVQNFLRKVG